MTAVSVAAALIAGALGALLRYGITRAFSATPARLPWAVLVANIVGSLVAGVTVAVTSVAPNEALNLIALGGFAGGLTTFSTFGVETVQLALAGRWRAVTGSVCGNLVGGFGAFAIGWLVTGWFLVGSLV